MRQKKYQEALEIIDKLETLSNQIYGASNLANQWSICLRRYQVYAEMKGQEYKAEDYLKQYGKLTDKIVDSITECKELSCLKVAANSELMAGYIKLMRPEKVQKIHDELQQELKQKGLEVSTAQMTIDMMLIQSEQDP